MDIVVLMLSEIGEGLPGPTIAFMDLRGEDAVPQGE